LFAGGGADPGLADLTLPRGDITRHHDSTLAGRSSLRKENKVIFLLLKLLKGKNLLGLFC
jgi:hypothetical protein